METVVMFSQRLQTRQLLWWGKPNKWRNRESYQHLLHRLKENHTLRNKDHPDARWHCCDLWQRTLSNKWNSREFAQKHGCRVPTLYWYGRRVGRLPLDSVPEHFVIRPVWGDSRRGVYVFARGTELLRQRVYTTEELRTELRSARGWLSRFPVLVEEFVKTEEGRYSLPIEFRFHMFGHAIGAIEVVQRSGNAEPRFAFYHPSWEQFSEPMYTDCPPEAPIASPRCLNEMRICAETLAVAYGTYVRVDFYATDRGCVFGEFSTIPAGGFGFTPFAERYFGDLWQRTFADRT